MKNEVKLLFAFLLMALPALGGCGNSAEHRQLLMYREGIQAEIRVKENILKSLPDELERNSRLKKELKKLQTEKDSLEKKLKAGRK